MVQKSNLLKNYYGLSRFQKVVQEIVLRAFEIKSSYEMNYPRFALHNNNSGTREKTILLRFKKAFFTIATLFGNLLTNRNLN